MARDTKKEYQAEKARQESDPAYREQQLARTRERMRLYRERNKERLAQEKPALYARRRIKEGWGFRYARKRAAGWRWVQPSIVDESATDSTIFQSPWEWYRRWFDTLDDESAEPVWE